MPKTKSIINRKITLAVLCVSATMSVLLTVAQTLYSWNVELDKMYVDLDRHILKIEKSLATSVWYLDKVQIQSSIEQIASDTGVTGVELVVAGKDGIFAQKGAQAEKDGIKKSWSILNPQSGNGEEIANLTVFSTTSEIAEVTLNKGLFLLLTNAVKGLLVSMIFLYIIDRLVSQHLRELMRHIYRFDVNNITLFPRRNVKVKDEFDQLIEAFNDMQSSILQARNDQIAATVQLKKSQIESIEFAQKMAVSEVTTSVMHDVNNIISTINLIVLRSKRDGKVKSAAEILPNLLHEMDKAITAVMSIIKAQQALASGRGDVWDSVSVDQIIQDAVAIEAYTLESRNIALTITGDVSQWIVTRRFLVMSALVNCIKNARESIGLAKAPNPSIVIDVVVCNNEVLIKVTDNGLGASAETLLNLKQRGFTTKADGHGFGIDGCRKNMIALGGTLEIESEGLGLGATSIIRQPIDAQNATIKQQAETVLGSLFNKTPPESEDETKEESPNSDKVVPLWRTKG